MLRALTLGILLELSRNNVEVVIRFRLVQRLFGRGPLRRRGTLIRLRCKTCDLLAHVVFDDLTLQILQLIVERRSNRHNFLLIFILSEVNLIDQRLFLILWLFCRSSDPLLIDSRSILENVLGGGNYLRGPAFNFGLDMCVVRDLLLPKL